MSAPATVRCIRMRPPNLVDVYHISQHELQASREAQTDEEILPNVVALYRTPHRWARDNSVSYPLNLIWMSSKAVDKEHESNHAIVYLLARRGVVDDPVSLSDEELEACLRWCEEHAATCEE